MKLTDAERAEIRENFAAMSLPQKLDYIFDYYKFPLALALIAIVALGSVIYYRATHKEPVLYVAYANIAVGDALDGALGEGFVRSVGLNPRSHAVNLYRGLYLSRDPALQNHEYAYASQMKTMAAMSNRQLDVLLMNREAYDLMSAGGYLLPLEGLLEREAGLLQQVAEQLTENTVILEDNDVEHRLDESIPYRAVTEEVVNGLNVSRFPLFARAGFSGEVYLGVVGNSDRMDRALQYIDYLSKEHLAEKY